MTPPIFPITLKLVTLGFQSPLCMELGIHLLPHLPFQSSKLDWNLTEQIQNDSEISDCMPQTSPFALLFPYLISSSFLFPADFSQAPHCSLPALLKPDKYSFQYFFTKGHASTRKRMEPAVQFYPKAKPPRLYCL